VSRSISCSRELPRPWPPDSSRSSTGSPDDVASWSRAHIFLRARHRRGPLPLLARASRRARDLAPRRVRHPRSGRSASPAPGGRGRRARIRRDPRHPHDRPARPGELRTLARARGVGCPTRRTGDRAGPQFGSGGDPARAVAVGGAGLRLRWRAQSPPGELWAARFGGLLQLLSVARPEAGVAARARPASATRGAGACGARLRDGAAACRLGGRARLSRRRPIGRRALGEGFLGCARRLRDRPTRPGFARLRSPPTGAERSRFERHPPFPGAGPDGPDPLLDPEPRAGDVPTPRATRAAPADRALVGGRLGRWHPRFASQSPAADRTRPWRDDVARHRDPGTG